MSIASFYNNPDLADGFGATAGRSRPHRGLDFPKGTGTGIPSVAAGVVVVSEWSGALGNVIEVRHDDGRYFGYCHMNARGLPVGTRVSQGTILGPVGNTGSESFGAHVHVTNGNRQGAVFGASMSYLADPWPYIQNAINGGGGGGGAGWAFNQPDAATQARVQAALKARGRYNGPVDGVWGPNTIKGIQTTIRNVGYDGPIDGVPGSNTCYYVQVYAQKFGDYKGPIDRVLGPNGWNGFALGLERP